MKNRILLAVVLLLPCSLAKAEDPPVAAWNFNETSGATTSDVSDGSNTGTLTNGAVFAAGKNGNGVSFDGTDDYVNVPDAAPLDLTTAGTIMAWVKIDTLTARRPVLQKGKTATVSPSFGFTINVSNKPNCELSDGTNTQDLASAVTPATGVWVHFACTWNGSQLIMYKNEFQHANATQTVVPAVNAEPLEIGRWGTSTGWFDGVIDDVRIYNRALSLAEITEVMNTPLVAAPPTIDIVAESIAHARLSWTASRADDCDASGAWSGDKPHTTGTEDISNVGSEKYEIVCTGEGGSVSANVIVTASDSEPDDDPEIDTEPPSAPGNLRKSISGQMGITMAWDASTDDVGVVGYRLFKDAVQQGADTALLEQQVTGLTCGTPAVYGIEAFDEALNKSDRPTITASTDACTPPPPPPAPPPPVPGPPRKCSDVTGATLCQDFDTQTLGDWTQTEMIAAFPGTTGYMRGMTGSPSGGRTSIVDGANAISGKALRAAFPKDKLGSSSGMHFWPPIGTNLTEAYFGYWVRFDPDIPKVKGGKLPGLTGGTTDKGQPSPCCGRPMALGKGFSSRLMFVGGRKFTNYFYWIDNPRCDQTGCTGTANPPSGDGPRLNTIVWTPGKWHFVEQHVKLGTAGAANGLFQVWVDGVLMTDIQNTRIIGPGQSFSITKLQMETYLGGKGESWWSPVDTAVYFDTLIVKTSRIWAAP